jgi:hypothetical protein
MQARLFSSFSVHGGATLSSRQCVRVCKCVQKWARREHELLVGLQYEKKIYEKNGLNKVEKATSNQHTPNDCTQCSSGPFGHSDNDRLVAQQAVATQTDLTMPDCGQGDIDTLSK